MHSMFVFNKHKFAFWLAFFALFGVVFPEIKSAILLVCFLFLAPTRLWVNFDLNLLFLSITMLLYALRFPVDDFGFLFGLIFLPVSSYLVGKWAGFGFLNLSNVVNSLFLIGFSVSFHVVISVVFDIYQNGYANFKREVPLLGLGGGDIAATVLGGYLITLNSLASVFLCKNFSPVLLKSKLFYFLCVFYLLIVIIVFLKLGSRTQFFIFIISLTIGYFANFTDRSGIWRSSWIGIFLVGVFFVYYSLDQGFEILAQFQERIGMEEASVSSAGGRADRWIDSLNYVFVHPEGWSLDAVGYAHNLWLDIARVAGIEAFVFSLFFTLANIITFYCFLLSNRNNRLLLTAFLSVFICYHLLFFVEPIMDGFVFPFSSYCVILGIVSGFNVRRKT